MVVYDLVNEWIFEKEIPMNKNNDFKQNQIRLTLSNFIRLP